MAAFVYFDFLARGQGCSGKGENRKDRKTEAPTLESRDTGDREVIDAVHKRSGRC